MALTDRPSSERPREKLLERGPDALSDSERIAILLRTGLPGQDAIALAHQLITNNIDVVPICFTRAFLLREDNTYDLSIGIRYQMSELENLITHNDD